MTQERRCLGCDEVKSLDDYRLDRRSGRLSVRCKSCLNARARAQYKANPQAKLERNRAWTERNRERHQQLNREWIRNNKDKARQISRDWYLANKDRRRSKDQAWRQENPDARRAISTRRRARVKASGIYLVAGRDVARLLAKPCAYCQTAPSEHLDHVIPISRGGVHSIGNLIGSCRACNQRKGSRTITEWRKAT